MLIITAAVSIGTQRYLNLDGAAVIRHPFLSSGYVRRRLPGHQPFWERNPGFVHRVIADHHLRGALQVSRIPFEADTRRLQTVDIHHSFARETRGAPYLAHLDNFGLGRPTLHLLPFFLPTESVTSPVILDLRGFSSRGQWYLVHQLILSGPRPPSSATPRRLYGSITDPNRHNFGHLPHRVDSLSRERR